MLADLSIEETSSTLTGKIIGAAIEVHRALRPGLLESAYEACLIYELRLRRRMEFVDLEYDFFSLWFPISVVKFKYLRNKAAHNFLRNELPLIEQSFTDCIYTQNENIVIIPIK